MRTLTVLFTLLCLSYYGQNDSLNGKITHLLFSEYKQGTSKNRAFIKPQKTITYFNPLFYLSATGLFIYQNIISEQIQADCRYKTSCSQFTKQCVQKNGFLGLLRGLDQISACYPGVNKQYATFLQLQNNLIDNEYHYED